MNQGSLSPAVKSLWVYHTTHTHKEDSTHILIKTNENWRIKNKKSGNSSTQTAQKHVGSVTNCNGKFSFWSVDIGLK